MNDIPDRDDIEREFRSDNPYERCNAVARLAQVLDEEALSMLCKALRDKSPKVRYAALNGLLSRPDFNDPDVLLPLLDDANETIRVRAVSALARLGDATTAEELLSRLESCGPSESKMRATLLQAVGALCDEKTADRLAPYLEDEDDRVRANAVETVLSVNSRSMLARLERLLEDDNNRVRANAVAGLWHFAPERCAAVLEEMVASGNKWFKLSAAWAAGQVGTSDALTRILPLADDADPDIRILAIRTLAANVNPGILQTIERAASDSDTTVAYYARKALEGDKT